MNKFPERHYDKIFIQNEYQPPLVSHEPEHGMKYGTIIGRVTSGVFRKPFWNQTPRKNTLKGTYGCYVEGDAKPTATSILELNIHPKAKAMMKKT